jgi:hydrogenase maturation protease
LGIRVRFLQIVDRKLGVPTQAIGFEDLEPGYQPVKTLTINGREYHEWQESIEREVAFDFPLGQNACRSEISFPANRDLEILRGDGGQPAGVYVREQEAVIGFVDVSRESLDDRLSKISVQITNGTNCEFDDLHARERAILKSFVSTHLVFHVQGGELVSLLEPPDEFREAAALCENQQAWPVLVGDPGSRDTMLASPIILYDYPQIAPESPGNLFDGTEIDEVLSLRIQTLTEREKREAASVDGHVRELLERTHGLSDERLQGLHGRFSLGPNHEESNSKRDSVSVAGESVGPGDQVRLRPRGRADAMDVILDGLIATIQTIEQDVEGGLFVTVTINDDPGQDLGASGQPGHRFFFRGNEIELIQRTEEDA